MSSADRGGQVDTGIRAVLRLPVAYRLLQSLLGTEAARKRLAERHFRPRPGMRVLDLGCGPGSLADCLGDVDYLGIDIEPAYIDRARKVHGRRRRFEVGSATDLGALRSGSFDLVIANALLHHLDDANVTRLAGEAYRVLAEGGRFVSLDNAWIPRQPLIARALISWDRGLHVRTPAAYRALLEPSLGLMSETVTHDLLNVPYTLVVLEGQRR